MTKIFFIWNIQLVKNYGCFFSLYLWRFPFKNGFVLSPKIDDFEIEEPWKIGKLICMASNHKSESGTNCWLTGPVKSLAALSNEGKLKYHKLRHTFSKYQLAIILEMEVALKTTFKASSHQGSGLSIAAVYTGSRSIIITYLSVSALAFFMQSWFMET